MRYVIDKSFICFLVVVTWLRLTLCKYDVSSQSELNGRYKPKKTCLMSIVRHERGILPSYIM